jgi:hypothetical protein
MMHCWQMNKHKLPITRQFSQFQHDSKRIKTIVNKLKGMEPYFSKHKLREYNNLLMQNTILSTKHKSMELGALDIMFGGIQSKIFNRRIYMVCLKNTK